MTMRFVRVLALAKAVLLAMGIALSCLQGVCAQTTAGGRSGEATIRGTVRDAAGRSVPGAAVAIKVETDLVEEDVTDAAGRFEFSGLKDGHKYTLSAGTKGAGTVSIDVMAYSGANREKVELVLKAADAGAAMEFADKPNFSVAGVTDWTAVGGHGSDSTLRTSEALASETLGLKAEGTGHSAAPGVGDAHRAAGELAEKRGDPLAAVHEFEQAVRLDPSEENYFEWGSELLLHRAVWQAEQVLHQGANLYPKSARMLTGLGAALFAGARYDEAAARLCTASDLNPADPKPYLFMGKIQIAAPDPLPCVEQKLARFVQLQPANSLANYFYAMAILKRQRQPADKPATEQAESLLIKAVTLDTKCSDGYLQLGILSASRRDYPKAIDFYAKAVEANLLLSDAHYRLGVAYDRIGEPAKAKREFELHDKLKQQEAEEIERQRLEVKQFLVVQPGQPTFPTVK